MSVWALIAIKQRNLGKSRLSARLKDTERLRLVRQMLTHVIDCVDGCAHVNGTVVLSPERDGLSQAIEVIPDLGRDLNQSLGYASDVLRRKGAKKILVLHADLPQLQIEDIEDMVTTASERVVAVAPDKLQQGTNALCFPADLNFRFYFGEYSFSCHQQEVTRLGLSSKAVRTPGLAFDLDYPGDLDTYLQGVPVESCV